MGTKSGFLALFRCKEGAFRTEWSEPEVAMPWDAPYRPTLPAELLKHSESGFTGDDAW